MILATGFGRVREPRRARELRERDDHGVVDHLRPCVASGAQRQLIDELDEASEHDVVTRALVAVVDVRVPAQSRVHHDGVG